MLKHEFDVNSGILYLYPREALEKKDFEQLCSEIDPYIKQNGKINGLLIKPARFPFWKNLQALVTHIKFVGEHFRDVKKIAIVYDNKIASLLPKIAKYIYGPPVKHFSGDEQKSARNWIQHAG